MVKCKTLYGKIKKIPKERLNFRAAAYAVIVCQGKILLLKVKHTGRYFFPGGGLETGETLEQGLRRETKEETGIEISIGRLIHFEEAFFYYDPLKLAFQNFDFFYLCKPKSLKLISDELVDDGECEKPRWVEIKFLKEKDIQFSGEKVFKLIKKLRG